MARKRRRLWSRGQETELNLAAMLDMAFQLLMFFVLTFSPTPIESELCMALPPAQPTTSGGVPQLPSEQPDPRHAGSITVTVLGTSKGEIRDLAVGNVIVSNLDETSAEVRAAISRAGGTCRNLVFQVDGKLHYQELMDLIAACKQDPSGNELPIERVTFVELRGIEPTNQEPSSQGAMSGLAWSH